MKHLFFGLLLLTLVFTGCKSQQPETTDASDESAAPTLGVPMPTAEMLAALGPENTVPVHRLLYDPLYIIAGKPKQFLASPLCAGGEMFIRNVIAQKLLPMCLQFRMIEGVPVRYFDGINLLNVVDPNNIEFFVQTTGVERALMCTVPHPQDPNAPPMQVPLPIMRQVTVIRYSTPVDLPALLISALDIGESAPVILNSMKRTLGQTEYYDLTPGERETRIVPQRLVIGQIDERSLVLAEGSDDDILPLFSNIVPDNALLLRLKHMPVEENDLTLITSLEGNLSISLEELKHMQSMNMPNEFISLFNQHLRALSLSFNASAVVGQPMITICAEGRDDKSAQSIEQHIQGMRISAKVGMDAMTEEVKKMMLIPADFADALLSALTVEIKGTQVHVALNNFETLVPTVSEGIRTNQAALQQREMQEWRVEQLGRHKEFFVRYYTENGKFPADILDAEGKPLLSWRVAMLPTMGLGELYSKFKLDEPWNSEHNLALLNTVPDIFHALMDTDVMEPTKTIVRFFDSPGTPLSNRDIKAEDVKFPQSTLMFVIVTPKYAVEWTKPDSLVFDFNTIEEVLGTPNFLGVTFEGRIGPIPVANSTDPNYASWKQLIENLVKGTPMPPPPPPSEPPVTEPR